MITAIAFVVAALIPLGFLVVVKSFDFYQTGSAKFIIYSGVWGILSYFLAAQINPALVEHGVFTTDTVVRFAAPVIEEILKGLILLYLIRHADFKYFLDGAIYGFAAGIGFAIFENFEYILAHPSTALILAISRVLFDELDPRHRQCIDWHRAWLGALQSAPHFADTVPDRRRGTGNRRP